MAVLGAPRLLVVGLGFVLRLSALMRTVWRPARFCPEVVIPRGAHQGAFRFGHVKSLNEQFVHKQQQSLRVPRAVWTQLYGSQQVWIY